jgi:hypothetical protein
MVMTDAEILAAADRIKRRRRLEQERDAAKDADMLMLRWNVKDADVGYASIPVTYDQVKHLVFSHYAYQIAANKTFLDTEEETE